MKLPLVTLICAILAGNGTTSALAAPKGDFPFPPAGAGQKRWVVNMPRQADESLFQIEIFAGKVMDVDCNRHFLAGEWQEVELQGWGYTYFNFVSNGQVASTKMACPNQATRKEFVAAASKMLRYNSRLPWVIYTPEGYSVRYRIWQGVGQTKPAENR